MPLANKTLFMANTSIADVRKDGKLINSVTVVHKRYLVEIAYVVDAAISEAVKLPGCFWPTVADLEQHYPKGLGYSVVSS